MGAQLHHVYFTNELLYNSWSLLVRNSLLGGSPVSLNYPKTQGHSWWPRGVSSSPQRREEWFLLCQPLLFLLPSVWCHYGGAGPREPGRSCRSFPARLALVQMGTNSMWLFMVLRERSEPAEVWPGVLQSLILSIWIYTPSSLKVSAELMRLNTCVWPTAAECISCLGVHTFRGQAVLHF